VKEFEELISSQRTYLHPDHLCKSTDELWSCVAIPPKGLFIHDLPHGVPKRRFQTLKKA
jgi:hypothetical protein